MALRYRHDPPSFKLTEDIIRDIYKAKGPFNRYIFGYTVHFTQDKISKLQRTKLRPRSFRTFQKSFFDFLKTQKKADLNAAQADFRLKRRSDPYAGIGEYDRDGNYLGKFGDKKKEEEYQKQLDREGDEYAEPSATWEQFLETLPPEQKEWYRQTYGGGGGGEHGPRDADHSRGDDSRTKEPVDPFQYETFDDEVPPEGDEEKKKHSSRNKGKEEKKHSSSRDKRKEERQEQPGEEKRQKAATTTGGSSASTEDEPAATYYSKHRRLKNFDLSSLQRAKGAVEEHVPVSRGNYNMVRSKIIEGPDGGYVITGPTGCGKSTVALLQLFTSSKTRVLVIEPTQANGANIEHEFRHILPNLVARFPDLGNVPEVAFRALTTMREPLPQLIVSTTEKVLEYFNYYGRIAEFDYVVLDEFHLPIEDMVEMVELVRTFKVTKKYILVSATAQGFKVNPQLPPAVTRIRGVLVAGKFPPVLEGSDLDPRIWANRGDGTYGVVAPSVTMAKTLYRQYMDWNIRTFLITRHTYASDYMKAVKNFKPRTAFVLEPGVEAGVTLSLAVLVSMGATMAVRYDGDVVIEDIQPLDAIAAIQRGGRGGRVVPTLYIEPEPPKGAVMGSSADYYRAQAIIKMIALGAKTEEIKDNGIFAKFPRLRTVTRKLALAALVEGDDPFISIYRHNDAGQVFVECGGKGAGFETLAKHELKLYYWPTGFYVAPITDFSRLDSQPDTFVVRSHQLLAARTMVEAVPGLADKYTLGELVDLLIGKMDVYVNDLFDLLKSIFAGDKPQQFSYRGGKSSEVAPQLDDFLGPAPEVLKLFNHMATEPVGIKFVRNVFKEHDVATSEHSFQYGGKRLNFSFPDGYTKNGVLDVDKVSRDVHAKLQHILAVEILVNGAPEKCVDLMKYSERVSRDHVWFTRVREHSSSVNRTH